MALTFAPSSPASVPARYDVADVGSLGGPYSSPAAIDEGGDAVGTSLTGYSAPEHAFLYAGGTLVDLGATGGRDSHAWAVNGSRAVAGELVIAIDANFSRSRAVLFSDGGTLDLGTLGGTSSSALGINDRGDVVGWSQFSPLNIAYHAFLRRDGVMLDLVGLSPYPDIIYSVAADVNGAGDVVGWSDIARNGPTHAFRWRDGVITDLGTLGGDTSLARAINESGQIVGSATVANDPRWHAVLWQDGAAIDLGTLDGGSADAMAINDLGDVVGRADGKAVLFTRDGVVDLGLLVPAGFRLISAMGINNAGQIVVDGSPDGSAHALVLTPVWCGNGIVDAGEECDAGSASGCCTADCRLEAPGTVCRPATDSCDLTERCDGVTAACPDDARVADTDGDGWCDAIDDCPGVADPAQVDSDGDGVGDACDACTGGAAITDATLQTRGWATATADDRLTFRAVFTLPGEASFDVLANGARVQLEDGGGRTVADAFLAPGAGWTARGSTGAKFTSRTAVGGAVSRVALTWTVGPPARVRVRVRGSAGSFARLPVELPLRVRVVLGGFMSAQGQCGETVLQPPPSAPCAVQGRGNAIVCRYGSPSL